VHRRLCAIKQSQAIVFAPRDGGALDDSLGLRPNPESAPADSLAHRLRKRLAAISTAMH